MVERNSQEELKSYETGDAIFADQPLTPDEVKAMTQPTQKLHCRLQDNTYLTFGRLLLQDSNQKLTFAEISEELQEMAHNAVLQEEIEGNANLDNRTVRYRLPYAALNIEGLSLNIEINVPGDEPIKDLLMIEKHYVGDQLIKMYEFKFPFCMPKSKNTCHFIYDLPKMEESQKEDLVANPWTQTSDTFFFIGDKLIIHNKTAYSYAGPDEEL